MLEQDTTIGIIGGTGMLGKAITRAILNKELVPAGNLWISNRSGTAEDFADQPDLNVTANNQDLADACDIILFCVPPAMAAGISVEAGNCLVLSVMAGISLMSLERMTGSKRVIRAMSSPAAERALAYSPWCAGEGVTSADRAHASAVFGACGLADEVASEAHIECFTAMTGPVPGFVAFFAEAMEGYATSKGIPSEIAERAVRQLFLGAGILMSEATLSPAEHVKQMIDYSGTTAAGLITMKRSSIARDIAEGLDDAVARTRSMG